MADAPLHVVVFPWLAFGHMIPFLELSKSLATRGHKVSYLATPRNLRRLPPLPPHLSHLIHLVPIPLPPTSGLPADAEATTDLPPNQVPLLKKSHDRLADAVAAFLRSASPAPDWVIQDFSQHWLPTIAANLGIPSAFFSIFPAVFCAYLGPVTELKSAGATAERLATLPEWVPFPSPVAYRLHEARGAVAAYNDASSGITDCFRVGMTIEGCRVLAFRSCLEFESQWLGLLPDLYGKPVITAGLLPPPVGERDDTEIINWLSKQETGSVIYAALGSEATLSVELIQELALGLELANIPCIWALRKPAGLAGDVEILPEGFEDRVRARGLLKVVMGWVPQVKVLAHEAVGGFLTHCGWSSIVEGIGLGRPLVMLPIFVDQGLNARVMAEKRLGLEVERREEDGYFTREAVAKAVRLVMVEGKGEEFRANAKKMSSVFGDKDRHERYMDGFVQYLKDHGGDSDRAAANS